MVNMKREISAGGIVFRIAARQSDYKKGKEVKIMLIKDAYGRWSFPKGHIEKGESAENAALREISEETGLKKLKIVEKLGTINYIFTLKGRKIFKTFIIYLIEAGDSRFKISWEIKDAKWFNSDDALEKIGYSNSKPILKKAIKRIEKA